MEFSWLPPTITLVLGILGTLAVERIRAGRFERREARLRLLTKRDRRDRYELDTLRASYDATEALTRAASRGEPLRLADLEAQSQSNLILDDALRSQVRQAIGLLTSTVTDQTPVGEGTASTTTALVAVAAAQAAVAERIRDFHTATDSSV